MTFFFLDGIKTSKMRIKMLSYLFFSLVCVFVLSMLFVLVKFFCKKKKKRFKITLITSITTLLLYSHKEIVFPGPNVNENIQCYLTHEQISTDFLYLLILLLICLKTSISSFGPSILILSEPHKFFFQSY